MRIAVRIVAGLVLGLVATAGRAAPKTHNEAAAAKPPPACAAIAFRALPTGQPDGEQSAGLYKSRLARIELHAAVKGGSPETYFAVANGKPLAAAPNPLPEAAVRCAAAKKLPKPETAAATCTGDRFRLAVAHAGTQRIALLYALQGGVWKFCNAGGF